MRRMYVYYGCLALLGGTYGGEALLTGATRGWDVPLAVQGIAGVLLVAAAGRELAVESPSDFEVGPAGFWVVVLGVSVLLLLRLL